MAAMTFYWMIRLPWNETAFPLYTAMSLYYVSCIIMITILLP